MSTTNGAAGSIFAELAAQGGTGRFLSLSRRVFTGIAPSPRQGIGWATSTVVPCEAVVEAGRHELVRSWRFIARPFWLVRTVAKGEMDTRPGDGVEVTRAEEGEGGRVDRRWRLVAGSRVE